MPPQRMSGSQRKVLRDSGTALSGMLSGPRPLYAPPLGCCHSHYRSPQPLAAPGVFCVRRRLARLPVCACEGSACFKRIPTRSQLRQPDSPTATDFDGDCYDYV